MIYIPELVHDMHTNRLQPAINIIIDICFSSDSVLVCYMCRTKINNIFYKMQQRKG